MINVTRILSRIESGDPSAADQLLPLVYDELRKLAAAKLAQEKPGQTLQATAWYMKLICGWLTSKRLNTGIREVIFSQQRLNQCDGLSSKPPDEDGESSVAVTAYEWTRTLANSILP